MSRYPGLVLIALAASLCMSVLTLPDAWNQFRFRIGNYDIGGETDAVKNTIRQFSASVAGIYASAGNPAGLNIFPAERLVKRRVFMDVDNMRNAGMAFVMDRDSSKVKEVGFLGPAHAVAVVEENWFNQYQDLTLRQKKPLSDKKANLITVRYLLKKLWNRWIIIEYEVFGQNEPLPELPVERVLSW